MDEQVAALGAIEAEYIRAPVVQAHAPYLAMWFKTRIDAFVRQRPLIERAFQDPVYAHSPAFDWALSWFQSLGQAFDVDLTWSGRDDEVHTRNGEMQSLVYQLRTQDARSQVS